MNIKVAAVSEKSINMEFTKKKINRGSHMSAHVLLNLLNQLGKRDKMRGLLSIFFFFARSFNNKCDNTGARVLDYIHHMAFGLL